MSALFDNFVTVDGFGVTTLTTPGFTISALPNRAASLTLHVEALFTGASPSLGGVAAVAIAGATIDFASTMRITNYAVTNPPAGSQTATSGTWTGSGSASLGVITATGVDQTTPLNNGVGKAGGFGTSISQAVTSTAGDLTCSWCANDGATTTITTNQTKKVSDFCNGDIGGGLGTTTHTWTLPSSTPGLVAANFKAAGGAPVYIPLSRPFPFKPSTSTLRGF